jgi:MgtC family
MSFPDVTNAVSHWAFLPTLVRLALALGTGAFVGLEREHRGKAGARTFTFASLIGCWEDFLDSYALLAIILIGLFVCFLNFREWRLHQNLLLTTSAALIIVGYCGVLCGKGHTFTPVATAVITAALLAWKQPITGFATGLS